MSVPSIAFALAAMLLVAAPATSAPTPIPGGADQVTAIAGTVGKPVWNGVLKITVLPLRDATDEEARALGADPSKKAMYFAARLQNGTHAEFTDLLTYTLADADGISAEIPSNALTHANLHVLQGGAQTQTEVFAVDKDFVPVKLIVRCATCGAHSAFRSIRFAMPR